MRYEPSWESLKQHLVPEWFHDAKLGVLVVWGLFSVPGWAPLTGDFDQVVREQGWETFFRENPYAEWYYNSIRFPDSPSRHYHNQTYGQDFDYDDFVPMFEAAMEGWQPDEWVELFEKAGVRYVVFLTKHHDGFLLWPSQHLNPHKPGYQVKRDVTGELAAAVRGRGMRLGVYYSSGLDWSYQDDHIRDYLGVFQAVPQGDDYVACVDAHWRELIDRYQPSVLWSDIAHPAGSDLAALFADYYNQVPDGVVNDRFAQELPRQDPHSLEIMGSPTGSYYDFRTAEYTSFKEAIREKWESNRGLAHSYSFNRNERPENYMSVTELVRLLVDVVSKNGNLLLSFGPTADGRIPELQRERLESLGEWLDVHGEAIYGTRPWLTAGGTTREKSPVRFTHKEESVYAMLWDLPGGNQVAIQGLRAVGDTTVRLLGHQAPLGWKQDGDDLVISLPDHVAESPAYALKITPAPKPPVGVG
jgi:alpha-L-fucosidase